MSTDKILQFKVAPAKKLPQELIRFKILFGPDYGKTFVCIQEPFLIGRAEECDLILSDPKASRQHARIKRKNSQWIIEDVKSSNGILMGEKSLPMVVLKLNDEFTIGQTQFLIFDPFSLPALEAKKMIATQKTQQAPTSKILMLVLSVAGVLVLVFTDNSPPPPPTPAQNSTPSGVSLDELQNANQSAQLTNKSLSEAFILKDGIREYYAGNYSRAKLEFATVLQVYPYHSIASLYLEKASQAIENSINYHMEKGKQTLEAGKTSAAKGHFEAVLRFLKRNPRDERYLLAEKSLKDIKTQDLTDSSSTDTPPQ
jgi:hypothetical protein